MAEIDVPTKHVRLDDGRPFTPAERRAARESVATAIGHFVIVWSNLHEELSKLFVEVSGDLNKWRKKRSDKGQRNDLLRPAVDASILATHAKQDVEWLLDKIDEMHDDRNDAAHAPYIYVRNGDETLCLPNWLFGDSRADRIAGTDFVATAYRRISEAEAYSEFAGAAAKSVRTGEPWPKRPQLSAV